MIKIVKEYIGFQLYTFIFFGIEYIPLEVLSKIRDNWITHNIFRKQHNESIMLLCVDCIVLLSQNICLQEKLCYKNDYKKNDKIIYVF